MMFALPTLFSTAAKKAVREGLGTRLVYTSVLLEGDIDIHSNNSGRADLELTPASVNFGSFYCGINNVYIVSTPDVSLA